MTMRIARPEILRPARCRGRSEARRTGANATRRPGARGSGSRGASGVTCALTGTASPIVDRAGEGVVLAVRRRRPVRIDLPDHRRPGGNGGGHALAVGEAEQVVELLVDALRLPLAVHAAGPLGDGVVVAVTVGDAALEALAQRADELGGELGAHRRQRSVRAEVDGRARR